MNENIFNYLAQYLEYHRSFKKSVKPTLVWHRNVIQRFAKETKLHNVCSITTTDAQDFVYCLNSRWNRLETVKNNVRSLKAFFNWLKKRKVVEINPFVDLELPGKDEPRIKFMLEDEVKDFFSRLRRCDKFYANFDKSRAIAIFSLAYWLGLRLGEIRHLKHEDIDFDKKLIRISRQKNKGITFLPLASRVSFDLQQYIREKRKLGLDSFYLIASRWSGNGLSYSTYRRLIIFIKKHICPTFKGYHCLRHSNATSLLRQGVDIQMISKLLRHSSTKVTEIYAKLIPEDLRQTVDILDY